MLYHFIIAMQEPDFAICISVDGGSNGPLIVIAY